jgi:hypothetical protein
MKIWISRNGQNHGPYSVEQLQAWLEKGQVSYSDMAWHQGPQWRPLGDLLREAGCVLPPPPQVASTFSIFAAGTATNDAESTIRRIADYERVSGILWIVIGVFQCLTLVGLIAGIWNIVAGISRIRIVPIILQRGSGVPSAFEGIGQLIVIGIINLMLGGLIGVLFVIFDFVIRDMVLRNRHIFEQAVLPSDHVA